MSGIPSLRQLRSFGLIFAVFFAAVSAYPLIAGAGPRIWALAPSVIAAAAGLLFPRILRRPYEAWMRFGAALGWLNSRILLGLMYFLVFAPMGVLMRLLGKDPMKRRIDPSTPTYRVARAARDASHMDHQF